jgi:multidrug efflux pump subunit AcrA (membrane-fusion protein)
MTHRRKRAWVVGAFVLIVVLVVTVALLVDRGGDGGSSDAAPKGGAGAVSTVEVERTTLVATEDVDGTLGFEEPRRVVAPQGGIITSIAATGATLRRGAELLRIDDDPGFLLIGNQPMYRTLSEGSDGPDVRQLEANMRALRRPDDPRISVDGDFDSATRRAVERLQRRLDVDDTGRVEVGQILFFPGVARVAKRLVTVGDRVGPGTPVLDITSTRRTVTAQLETVQADIAAVGDAVDVELPGGVTAKGTVTEIGAQATRRGGPDGPTVIPVTVRLKGASGAKLYDQAPVTVTFERERAKDTLAVPTTALLALREGGFAVEVERPGDNRLVRVTPSLYSSGMVAVDSADLKEGMRVVVPA